MQLPPTTATPSAVLARKATTADIDRLAALHLSAVNLVSELRGGAQLLAECDRGSALDEIGDSMSAELAGNRSVVFVGCIGDAVIGYASVRFSVELHKLAELRELFVDPRARRVGVGGHLLTEVRGEATRRGCVGIDAVALPGDRDTKNFFEDHAMVARAIVVHGRLEA